MIEAQPYIMLSASEASGAAPEAEILRCAQDGKPSVDFGPFVLHIVEAL